MEKMLDVVRLLLKCLVGCVAVLGMLELILLGQLWISNLVWYVAYCGVILVGINATWRWICRIINRAIDSAKQSLGWKHE